MVSDKQKHIVALTAVIVNNGRVLVMQRGEDEIAFPGKWGFPGGKVEQGETPLEALKREVIEEVGIEASDFKLLTDFTFIRPDGHNVVGFAFTTNVDDDKVVLHSDFQNHKWVTLDEMKQLDVSVPELIHEAEKALKHT